MKYVLWLDNVSKYYQLGANHFGLRGIISPVKKLSAPKGAAGKDFIWALKNVSFNVQQGEVLGIIGRNGAGKTTLLKLISKVTRPTSGKLEARGRISTLIELGAGFHPDLTGRENIFLNGVILGLTRKELAKKYSSIVEFAELEQFIDTPVKRYSSGMYARLGFSVAAHSDPDLLLVDEVLAVGDAAFQQKCYDFMHAYVRRGSTVVFVSHNLYVIEQLCQRVIWLENGQIAKTGLPSEVLPAYFDYIDQMSVSREVLLDAEKNGSRNAFHINRVYLVDIEGNPITAVRNGEDLFVKIEFCAGTPTSSPKFVIGVSGPEGGMPIFLASMLLDGTELQAVTGPGSIVCRFFTNPLTPKIYHIWGEVYSENNARLLVNWQKLASFRIEAEPDGKVGKGGLRHLRADAPVQVPYQWEGCKP